MVDVVTRAARSNDDELNALSEVVTRCLSERDPIWNPPSPNELRSGIAAEQVLVAVLGDAVVGFIQYQQIAKRHILLTSLAVQPERQGTGIACKLVDDLRRSLEVDGSPPAISMDVHARNYRLLHILCDRDFVAHEVTRDRTDSAGDRLHCTYLLRSDFINPNRRVSVEVTAAERVDHFLGKDYAITATTKPTAPPTRQFFSMCKFDADDPAGLQADETSTSVTFAGTILAAITFVLSISFGSTNFPDSARVLLMVSVLATTMALVIHTNASGGISRLRSNDFKIYMQTGNVLSEFGGVHLFLASLPIAFTCSTGSLPAGMAMGLVFSVGLLLYERSRFSISSRFAQSLGRWMLWLFRLLRLVVITAPLTGVLAVRLDRVSWAWAIGVVVVFALISVLLLRNRLGERTSNAHEPRSHVRD
ncbi:GNAT family N-acetyltransferase [Nocardia huaxiensis]|uniref:GNAT family N-acetyltransferase n=1 Tax=Nocardia huaxiensis TaxID=2755382 RepID=UPI001E397295|nr:GNAT family N-acetyltransferase [Nocardia huaxiensis]UFS94515.1 GNAT family N-acetyltransferase [Nocardia huaxiensis]